MKALPLLIASLCLLVLCGCTQPPRSAMSVNQELSPQDYLTQGIKLKQSGRIEESRMALQKAIDGDPQGQIAQKARLIIKYKLPAATITTDAAQRNIVGYNHLRRQALPEARQTFQRLIKDYPKFEWPYLNMGYVEAQAGDTDSAIQFAETAVSLNPNYAAAWTMLRKLYLMKGDEKSANRCTRRLDDIAKDLTQVTIDDERHSI